VIPQGRFESGSLVNRAFPQAPPKLPKAAVNECNRELTDFTRQPPADHRTKQAGQLFCRRPLLQQAV